MTKMDSIAQKVNTASKITNTNAMRHQAMMQNAASRSAMAGAAGMAAFGVAVAGVGAGVYLLAEGMALIVNTFKDLNDEQMGNAALGLLAFGGAIYGLSLALGAAFPLLTMTYPVLLAFGAVVLGLRLLG